MSCPGWHELSCDQKEALETIATKIARILNGDPDYIDNWVDIAGYAMLVVERLKEAQELAADSVPDGHADS